MTRPAIGTCRSPSFHRWVTAGLWFLLNTLAVAGEPDPRPSVLVLGDFHSLPFQGKPSWVDFLRVKRPDWNIQVSANGNRLIGTSLRIPIMKKDQQIGEAVYPGVLDELDAILKDSGKMTMVILFLGANHARKSIASSRNPSQCGDDLSAVLKNLTVATQTSGAKLVVISPMPVVEARLDTWSKAPFEGGEALCRQIAEAFVGASHAQGALSIDAWTFGWERKDKDGNPGELLGSTGWIMRDWAQRIFADWLIPQLEAFEPKPVDAEGFAEWKRLRQAMESLSTILSETSEGLVSYGRVLEVLHTKDAKAASPARVQIPAELLRGPSLDLLIMPDTTENASVGIPCTPFNKNPLLLVRTELGEQAIKPRETASQVLDEAAPETVIPQDKYGLNYGKWQPYPSLCSVVGKRRWLLLRFDLSGLKGKTVQGGEAVICYLGNTAALQQLVQATPQPLQAEGRFGTIKVYTIDEADREWAPGCATWKRRDGKAGWTGGAVDADARKARLEKFLAGEMPESAKAAARRYLNRTEGNRL